MYIHGYIYLFQSNSHIRLTESFVELTQYYLQENSENNNKNKHKSKEDIKINCCFLYRKNGGMSKNPMNIHFAQNFIAILYFVHYFLIILLSKGKISFSTRCFMITIPLTLVL